MEIYVYIHQDESSKGNNADTRFSNEGGRWIVVRSSQYNSRVSLGLRETF